MRPSAQDAACRRREARGQAFAAAMRGSVVSPATEDRPFREGPALARRGGPDVPDEGELERALAAGGDAWREVLDREHARASDAARRRLSEVARRNRRLAEDLRARYRGRCQLCAFDPEVLYGRGICEAHHIVYLSHGGDDAIENMLLVCPNHHEAIHATSAVFDFGDLHYLYPGGRREPLVLNEHLRAA